MKVLNFGSLNLDYVYQVEHFVQPGETLSASSQAVNPGGKGLNQSIALARAGAEVYHAGCLGIGGEALGKLLRENGVDTSYLVPSDELQGNAVIQVDPSGQNCILLFGGSNQSITSDQVDKTLAAFSEGEYLVLQNEVNDLPMIVEKAWDRGMKIVLNPSPYNEKLSAVDFGKLSWLLVNEVEAAQLSGSGDPEEAWRVLHEAWPGLSVLITLGSAGSVAWRVEGSKLETARQEAFRVRAVDTTAAGDTFTGFFIGALLEGRPLAESMRRASMASALGVTRPGAAASIPTRDEVEEAMSRAEAFGQRFIKTYGGKDKVFPVRPLESAETGAALELAWRVFCEFESPDYAPEGTEEFKKCLGDEAYLAGICYYGAFDGEKLVGILGIRAERCHICFFFVDGGYQRLGIGTGLFRRMREDFPGRTITLNSSPYGLPFYQALGFAATDCERTVNGIRFTPMEYKGDV